MRKLSRMRCVVAVTVLVTAGIAKANSIPAGSYDLTNVTVDGYQLTGSVTISSGGEVGAADIKLNDAALGNPVFTGVSSEGSTGYGPSTNYAFITAAGVGQLALEYLPTVDSAGDVDLCIASVGACNSYQASYLQVYGNTSFGYDPRGPQRWDAGCSSHEHKRERGREYVHAGAGNAGAARDWDSGGGTPDEKAETVELVHSHRKTNGQPC
jgi:hypothetical protein